MKQFFVVFLIGALLLVIGNAQTKEVPGSDVTKSTDVTSATPHVVKPAVEEPDYGGRVYLLLDSKLVKLESQQPSAEAKLKMLGFKGQKSTLNFKGPASSVRAKGVSEFVLRVDPGGLDPEVIVRLSPLKSEKNERLLAVGQVGNPFGGDAGAKAGRGETIPLTFAKYGDHSVRFSTSSPLPKGEYVIVVEGIQVNFLFGVD